jgi:tripartite-type tricarboxylate transporter receptor subunit TctC
MSSCLRDRRSTLPSNSIRLDPENRVETGMPVPAVSVARSLSRLAILAAFTLIATQAANAQPYPAKAARIIVPYTPGGSNDVLARVVAQKLQDTWQHPFVVENKPGAAGQIGAEAAAKSRPDGYTLLVAPNDVLTIMPNLYAKVPYDPVGDFEPVATLGSVPVVLVVNAASPITSVADLIVEARRKPETLTYASSGSGGPQHISAEMLQLLAGIKLVHVPYKGNAPAVADLLGGQVTLLFSPINSALPHIRSGKLRALAVATEKRISYLPEIPTLAEAGVLGYKHEIWIGLLAPARTPGEIVDKLSREVTKMQGEAEVREKLAAQGIEPMIATPEEFAAMIKHELPRWKEIIKRTGIKPD